MNYSLYLFSVLTAIVVFTMKHTWEKQQEGIMAIITLISE